MSIENQNQEIYVCPTHVYLIITGYLSLFLLPHKVHINITITTKSINISKNQITVQSQSYHNHNHMYIY